MAQTKLQATQTVLHDQLSEIGNAVDEQLNSVLDKINTNLKVPGLLSLGAGKIINVGNTTISKSNSTNIRLALGDVDLGGLSGSINFANGTVTGQVQSTTCPTMTASNYVKAGFEIRADQKIYLVWGAQGASEILAGFPNWSNVSVALGYVTLQDDGTGGQYHFNSLSNAVIYQLDGSGGSEQLSDHTLLTNRDAASQHPTSAIATAVGDFTSSLSSAETTAQLAFVRLDQFNSCFNWATSIAYRVGNIVKQNGTIYRCIVIHTSSVFATDLSGGKWELAVSAQDHNTLANRDAASAHPATAVSVSTASFSNAFASYEDTVQKALDRVDDYASVFAWTNGNVYRLNNVVTSGGNLWRCSTGHTASGSFDASKFVLLIDAPQEELQTVGVGGQSVFTLSTVTVPAGAGGLLYSKLMVFINGVLQLRTTHYTVDSATQVTFSQTIPQYAQVFFRVG